MTRVFCCSQSDVWALGCVLYELTTLNHAFDGANMCALVLKILRGTYPPIPGEYSQELRSLIDSMLQAKPDDRPSVLDIIRTPVILSRIRQFERAEREKSRLHLDVVQDLSASRDMGGARAPGVAAAAAAAAPSTSGAAGEASGGGSGGDGSAASGARARAAQQLVLAAPPVRRRKPSSEAAGQLSRATTARLRRNKPMRQPAAFSQVMAGGEAVAPSSVSSMVAAGADAAGATVPHGGSGDEGSGGRDDVAAVSGAPPDTAATQHVVSTSASPGPASQGFDRDRVSERVARVHERAMRLSQAQQPSGSASSGSGNEADTPVPSSSTPNDSRPVGAPGARPEAAAHAGGNSSATRRGSREQLTPAEEFDTILQRWNSRRQVKKGGSGVPSSGGIHRVTGSSPDVLRAMPTPTQQAAAATRVHARRTSAPVVRAGHAGVFPWDRPSAAVDGSTPTSEARSVQPSLPESRVSRASSAAVMMSPALAAGGRVVADSWGTAEFDDDDSTSASEQSDDGNDSDVLSTDAWRSPVQQRPASGDGSPVPAPTPSSLAGGAGTAVPQLARARRISSGEHVHAHEHEHLHDQEFQKEVQSGIATRDGGIHAAGDGHAAAPGAGGAAPHHRHSDTAGGDGKPASGHEAFWMSVEEEMVKLSHALGTADSDSSDGGASGDAGADGDVESDKEGDDVSLHLSFGAGASHGGADPRLSHGRPGSRGSDGTASDGAGGTTGEGDDDVFVTVEVEDGTAAALLLPPGASARASRAASMLSNLEIALPRVTEGADDTGGVPPTYFASLGLDDGGAVDPSTVHAADDPDLEDALVGEVPVPAAPA